VGTEHPAKQQRLQNKAGDNMARKDDTMIDDDNKHVIGHEFENGPQVEVYWATAS